MIDESVRAIRAFVDDAVATTHRLEEILKGPEPDEPVELKVQLVLDIGEEPLAAVTAELERLNQH